MKPQIISISGAVHSGKTTISRMIAVQMPNAMYVDGDLLSSYVGQSYPKNTTIDEMLPAVHKLIGSLLRASLIDGLDVIVDYVLDDSGRREVLAELNDVEFTAKWFLLKPSKEKILKGSNTRPKLNEWEINRINYHYSSPLMTSYFDKTIDSTNLTTEETVRQIMEEL